MANVAHSLRLLTCSVVRAACGQLGSNRRREMRRAVRLGCRVRRRDGRLVGDRTVDLSPQGLLVASDECLERGAELIVSFQATELPLWFDTQATVRRVVEGRRPGDHGRALGLHFESLPAVSRLILRGHLRKAPPVVPQRELPPELSPRRIDYAQAVRRVMLEG
jgi:PilZ domain-containing protein